MHFKTNISAKLPKMFCSNNSKKNLHLFPLIQVSWSRPGGHKVPVNSVQDRGRLEIHGVTRHMAGLYTCTAVEYSFLDGAQVEN